MPLFPTIERRNSISSPNQKISVVGNSCDIDELIQSLAPGFQVRQAVHNHISKLLLEVQKEAEALSNDSDTATAYQTCRRTVCVVKNPRSRANDRITFGDPDQEMRDLAILVDYIEMKLNEDGACLAQDTAITPNKRGTRRHIKRPRPVLQICLQGSSNLGLSSENDQMSSPDQDEARNRSDVMSAKDLWNEVQLLDEFLDLVHDGSFVKKAFDSMKLQSLDKAKAMQKVEAELMEDYGTELLASFEDVAL
jgi:hypothetical protein